MGEEEVSLICTREKGHCYNLPLSSLQSLHCFPTISSSHNLKLGVLLCYGKFLTRGGVTNLRGKEVSDYLLTSLKEYL